MCQQVLGDARLFELLYRIDAELAEEARVKGCTCGGRLHRAHYRRKPRGGPPDLDEAYAWRHSFCCAQPGCRKRKTPISVRFLGRRVLCLVNIGYDGEIATFFRSLGLRL